MPFCPKCGVEVGDADFCPKCGIPQRLPVQPQVVRRKKEQYNPFIGACLCCCLSPLIMFFYYAVTEPEVDSLKRTFILIVAFLLLPIILFSGFFSIWATISAVGVFFQGVFPIYTSEYSGDLMIYLQYSENSMSSFVLLVYAIISLVFILSTAFFIFLVKQVTKKQK